MYVSVPPLSKYRQGRIPPRGVTSSFLVDRFIKVDRLGEKEEIEVSLSRKRPPPPPPPPRCVSLSGSRSSSVQRLVPSSDKRALQTGRTSRQCVCRLATALFAVHPHHPPEYSLDTLYEEVYNEHSPEQDSLNTSRTHTGRHSPAGKTAILEDTSEGPNTGPASSSPKASTSGIPPAAAPESHRASNTLLRLLRRKKSIDMAERGEPFRHLWVALSSLYGLGLVLVMLACLITEVMDNAVRLFSLQGFLLLYMYVGGIAVILCIYVWVLIDSCGALSSSSVREYDSEDDCRINDDAENPAPLTRFGSLKRAHRAVTTGTSFYIRVGAIIFGLATLVFSGLEVAMHSTMDAQGSAACLSDVIFVHPVLHGLFTFLQMHFLFVNSQVVVERFGLAARFGFMHLAATNVALWVRLVVWESGTEWAYSVHLAQQHGTAAASFLPSPLELKGFPQAQALQGGPWGRNATHRVATGLITLSADHISQVVGLHECLNANALGQLWTSATPYLTPFIVQFSVISAAVTFVMGLKVGQRRHIFKGGAKGSASSSSCGGGVDCNSSSRGLFLGLLCVVGGIVVVIVFFVVRGDETFPRHLPFWLAHGTQATLLALAAALALVGIAQVRRLSTSSFEPSRLDRLLARISSSGVVMYAIFSLAAGSGRVLEMARTDAPEDGRAAALIACSALQLLHVALQSGLMEEVSRRHCTSRAQLLARPGRQIITCLLCLNAVMWVFDTLVTFSWVSQELQLNFFGVLAWGIISRISLPLLVLYRFHSCVRLLSSWQKAYN